MNAKHGGHYIFTMNIDVFGFGRLLKMHAAGLDDRLPANQTSTSWDRPNLYKWPLKNEEHASRMKDYRAWPLGTQSGGCRGQ